ncbi:hypothetical protein K491DRAFT_697826 [Lophiostoma macrostomum CBS 122681]|uniref:Uncharacterized protein n=1 Tax=Lophiostoma macrostomum CBS 122681 TaxID=1314788 RepID=A0A6A6SPJ7_9PLEO|nr:hypothetical protein K491DRAFT_697826 [Lophiostoma macrostomum CBS 122681]
MTTFLIVLPLLEYRVRSICTVNAPSLPPPPVCTVQGLSIPPVLFPDQSALSILTKIATSNNCPLSSIHQSSAVMRSDPYW